MKRCGLCKRELPLTEFYTSVSQKSGYQTRCKDCCKREAKNWAERNPQRYRASRRKVQTAWRRRRGIAEATRRTPEQRAELHRRQERERYASETARIKARVQKWQLLNRDSVAARNAFRKAAKRKATPAWANRFFIQEAYHLAKLRERFLGGKWHVDHVVPLVHGLVCGLHCEDNLEVIPASVNCSKQNYRWPDMPERAKQVLGT